MVCQLFSVNKSEPIQTGNILDTDVEKLVEIQAKMIVAEHHATCFDVKQLQEILGVGESNIYSLLRSGKLSNQTIGKRKVVPVVALAEFLVKGSSKNNLTN